MRRSNKAHSFQRTAFSMPLRFSPRCSVKQKAASSWLTHLWTEKALTDFGTTMPVGPVLQLLSDAKTAKPSLKPAVERWRQQYGAVRFLEARLAPDRTLHDRLIVIDASRVWVLTQSLNALAARSPASVVTVDAETAKLKVAAYQDVWAKKHSDVGCPAPIEPNSHVGGPDETDTLPPPRWHVERRELPQAVSAPPAMPRTIRSKLFGVHRLFIRAAPSP